MSKDLLIYLFENAKGRRGWWRSFGKESKKKKKTKKHPNSNLQKATTRVALDLRHPSLVPRNVGNRTGAIESRPLFRLYFPGTMRYRFFLLLLLFLVLLLLLHAGQRDKETKRVTGRSDVSANILDRRR